MPATPFLRFLPPIPARVSAVLVVLGVALLAAPSARASVPNYKGSSADGSVVFFESDEKLVPGDTDFTRDVYERSFDEAVDAYVTREVSLGPTGGNDAFPAQFEAVSGNGLLVFFSTQERLVAEDTDRSTDVYMRNLETGATTLVTKGAPSCLPGCGNGAFPVAFAEATGDGAKVFFETKEQLAPEDTDNSTDLYMRNLAGGETVLVSAGESSCSPGCGNGEFDVSRRGISGDGRYAYFTTEEPLSNADTDSARDVYARDLQEGKTYLVSRGQCSGCGNSGAEPIFDGSSADGSRVFFSTAEKLVEGDDDEATDVYARDLPAGPTTLISGGSKKTTASYAAASADGKHVFFTSAEGLLGADEDNANDVYEWSEGAPPNLKLVTSAECTRLCGASFEALSEDAEEVVFTTAEALVAEDRDESDDIYRQNVNGGAPVLISRGEDSCTSCWSGEENARFNEASADASRVVFSTAEGILEGDDDGEDDIYLRDTNGAGTTSMITIAPSYCPLKPGNCGATFVGASADGEHVFFRSVERFTLEDGDNEADIYERDLSSPGEEVTRLVSTENDPKLVLGPEPPQLLETSPESPGQSTTPRLIGEAEPGAKVKVYTSPDCSGEPVATGTAEELLDPGLQATVAASSLTSFRATAEAEGFVSECSAPLSYEEVTPIGGGEAGGGSGGSGGGSAGTSGGTGAKVEGATAVAKGQTYLVPHTRITYGPGAKTRRHRVVFRFADSTGQTGTRFRCKLDRKRWRGCRSPLRLKHLGRGRHVLRVRAVNAAGTWEPRAARRAFKVVPR
ncbi:MAG TPA: hypothetical protein VFK14_13375 [Solirubrobacterales bacterium]|nr:hypothetical protein [Solirubrobacterales bacterium]